MRLADTRPPFAGLANLSWEALASLPTPCYLLDEAQLRRNGQIMLELQQRTGCRALLAQKAFWASRARHPVRCCSSSMI